MNKFQQPATLPPISVVVCTRDRPQALARCLAALAQLDYPAYEVVVIDNASRDEATALVAASAGVRCIREERPGLDWARNRGVIEARYAIIVFTDDDAEADPGWLRGIVAAFADPQVDIVTGLVVPAELATEAQQLFELYGGMGKGQQPHTFQRAHMRPRDLIAAHHCGVGANMAFRRDALDLLGGFDTALDVGTPAHGGGDLDIFHRALIAGLTLRYEPRARVRHTHRRTVVILHRQLEDNGRSFGVYLLKIWACRSVPRPVLVRFALGWVGGWLVARLLGCAFGRIDFPVGLAWAELWGALQAPAAYRATYRPHSIRSRGVRVQICPKILHYKGTKDTKV